MLLIGGGSTGSSWIQPFQLLFGDINFRFPPQHLITCLFSTDSCICSSLRTLSSSKAMGTLLASLILSVSDSLTTPSLKIRHSLGVQQHPRGCKSCPFSYLHASSKQALPHYRPPPQRPAPDGSSHDSHRNIQLLVRSYRPGYRLLGFIPSWQLGWPGDGRFCRWFQLYITL